MTKAARIAFSVAAVAGAALAATQARAAASPELVGPPDLGPAPGPSPDEARAEQNVRAFLFMIRTAEGTADANGYRALFGHKPNRPRLFDSFADHPRVATKFTDKAGRQLWTSAAGAFQFMAVSTIPGGSSTRVDTWDNVKRALSLPDFSPESQDRAAVELIRRRGALGDVRAGRFAQAVHKVRAEWASLPGAGYDQQERTLDAVQTAYLRAGGTIA